MYFPKLLSNLVIYARTAYGLGSVCILFEMQTLNQFQLFLNFPVKLFNLYGFDVCGESAYASRIRFDHISNILSHDFDMCLSDSGSGDLLFHHIVNIKQSLTHSLTLTHSLAAWNARLFAWTAHSHFTSPFVLFLWTLIGILSFTNYTGWYIHIKRNKHNKNGIFRVILKHKMWLHSKCVFWAVLHLM